MDDPQDRLSFEHFCRLIDLLGTVPRCLPKVQSDTPLDYFRKYLRTLPQPLLPKHGKIVFRLLFPKFSPRRRYGLKEATLSRTLGKVLGLYGLREWEEDVVLGWRPNGVDAAGAKSGCLGSEIERLLKRRTGVAAVHRSTLTIVQVDELLDELASHSPYSNLGSSATQIPRPRDVILRHLFLHSALSPFAISVLTQVILDDLRPLLNPLLAEALHPTTALQTREIVPQLDIYQAMKAWDGRLRKWYRCCADLDWCFDHLSELGINNSVMVDKRSLANDLREEFELQQPGLGIDPESGPVLGVNIEIPKCEKGRSLGSALKMIAGGNFDRTEKIWAEFKYDGERMQIHVQIPTQPGVRTKIKIFSKSKRDSTMDRLRTHSIILASLGLDFASNLPADHLLRARTSSLSSPADSNIRSIIIEAEMLPYSEGNRQGRRGPGIEEFWCLGRVAGETPYIELPNHHHYLAFFDILYLNGQSLLNETYETRWAALESVIQPVAGFSQLVERRPINVKAGRNEALLELAKISEEAKLKFHEGVVLKAAESVYNDLWLRWVKVKRDYIPGLGDCVDMVIVGAGWDQDRARELRVGGSVYTTFFAAVLTNKQQTLVNRGARPHFEVLFPISYGLSREHLEVMNYRIRHGVIPNRPFQPSVDDVGPTRKRAEFTCKWRNDFRCRPLVVFDKPILFEVMGASFQKLLGSRFYELRWPRVQKIYSEESRSWSSAPDGDEYLQLVRQALGHFGAVRGSSVTLSPVQVVQDMLKSSRDAFEQPEPVSPFVPVPPPIPSESLTAPMAKEVEEEDIVPDSPVTPARPLSAKSLASRPVHTAQKKQGKLSLRKIRSIKTKKKKKSRWNFSSERRNDKRPISDLSVGHTA